MSRESHITWHQVRDRLPEHEQPIIFKVQSWPEPLIGHFLKPKRLGPHELLGTFYCREFAEARSIFHIWKGEESEVIEWTEIQPEL